MKKSKGYLTWMENPLIANGAEVFRIIGDMKNVRFAQKREVPR
jgi:hypothetical protein